MSADESTAASTAEDRASALNHFLKRHLVFTFMVMGLSFVGLGLISLNLLRLLRGNLAFLLENGLMGLRDGGLQQFLELGISGYVGMALYVLFTTCETVLVDRLLEKA